MKFRWMKREELIEIQLDEARRVDEIQLDEARRVDEEG